MDAAVLQVLIDSNFSIGFHGHQHKAQIIDEKFQFGSNRKITVVSAGTLCAGPKALPPGHPRAYNLIEIDTESLRARLHARTMQNDSFEQPIWAPGHLPSSQTSFVEFDLQRPLPAEIPRLFVGQDFLGIRVRVHGSQFFAPPSVFNLSIPPLPDP